MGSDDASTWTLVDSWTDIEYSSVITSSCSNVCNHARWSEPTTLTTDHEPKYQYFRIVILKTCGNAGPPYGCGGGNQGLQAVIFNEIELWGLTDSSFASAETSQTSRHVFLYPESKFTFNAEDSGNGNDPTFCADTDKSNFCETDGFSETNPSALVLDLGENPPPFTKIRIYNRNDSNVDHLKQLQYLRLVISDDANINKQSQSLKIPSIGWDPPVEESVGDITYGEDILPGPQQMLRCNGTTGKEMSQSYALITLDGSGSLNAGATFFLKVRIPAGDPENCLIEYDSNIHASVHRMLFSLERQCNHCVPRTVKHLQPAAQRSLVPLIRLVIKK